MSGTWTLRACERPRELDLKGPVGLRPLTGAHVGGAGHCNAVGNPHSTAEQIRETRSRGSDWGLQLTGYPDTPM